MLVALLGGALIGVGATLLWFANGRVAGVTGLVHGALRGEGAARSVSIAFVLGLALAGTLFGRHSVTGAGPSAGMALLVVAGVLVGFGARLGGGCTSGHGVCGISRFSTRSIVATLTFMATGAVAVFVTHHVLGGVH